MHFAAPGGPPMVEIKTADAPGAATKEGMASLAEEVAAPVVAHIDEVVAKVEDEAIGVCIFGRE